MPRYEDDDDAQYEDRPRRPRNEPRRELPAEPTARRDSLIERRMRVARGEDDYEEPEDRSTPYQRAAYRPAAYAPRYPAPTSGAATMLYMLIGVIAVGALLVVLAPRLFGSILPQVDVPAAIKQVVATPTPTLIDRGGTILQIRSLNRLETQQFSAERVIEAKNERGNPLDLVLGDRLLLIARGTVIAGVDMSKVKDTDVTIAPDGKSITINLPPSEIFVRTLDNNQTRIYDRTTGIFANQDKDLETKARSEAEAQILAAACEANVMQKAADDAEKALTQTMKIAGFQNVTVNARTGECTAPATVPTSGG